VHIFSAEKATLYFPLKKQVLPTFEDLLVLARNVVRIALHENQGVVGKHTCTQICVHVCF